ncbi:MAG TPA: IS200/IS605 family transposase [Chitinophagaceae bacterium]|nr:IS200/IS605 family transposase [Chitinophagaceae bacterium]
MAGTFSQVYIQYVFAVKGRENLIRSGFETEIYKYIAGIVSGKDQKPLAVNGMPDHVHVLVGLKPAMRISDLIRDIKNNSSNFINEKKWLKQKFNWQEGYGAFSYSESNYGKVIDYIKDQKRHHERRTFRQEYFLLLKKFNIPFEEKYLFEFYD